MYRVEYNWQNTFIVSNILEKTCVFAKPQIKDEKAVAIGDDIIDVVKFGTLSEEKFFRT
jgi:hypothetical protein